MRYTMSDKDELTMPKDTKQHSQQFKEDAVRYVKEHPDITLEQCAQNRGMGAFRRKPEHTHVERSRFSIKYVLIMTFA